MALREARFCLLPCFAVDAKYAEKSLDAPRGTYDSGKASKPRYLFVGLILILIVAGENTAMSLDIFSRPTPLETFERASTDGNLKSARHCKLRPGPGRQSAAVSAAPDRQER